MTFLNMFSFWEKHAKKQVDKSVGKKILEKQLVDSPLKKKKKKKTSTHLCTNLMHDMTEFMEVSPHLIVSQERGTTR